MVSECRHWCYIHQFAIAVCFCKLTTIVDTITLLFAVLFFFTCIFETEITILLLHFVPYPISNNFSALFCCLSLLTFLSIFASNGRSINGESTCQPS